MAATCAAAAAASSGPVQQKRISMAKQGRIIMDIGRRLENDSLWFQFMNSRRQRARRARALRRVALRAAWRGAQKRRKRRSAAKENTIFGVKSVSRLSLSSLSTLACLRRAALRACARFSKSLLARWRRRRAAAACAVTTRAAEDDNL